MLPHRRFLFHLALRRCLAALNGSWLGAWGLEALLWNALIFRRVSAAVGGRLRFLLSGGAPLSPQTQQFMSVAFW